jgi:hypothetical protein
MKAIGIKEEQQKCNSSYNGMEYILITHCDIRKKSVNDSELKRNQM